MAVYTLNLYEIADNAPLFDFEYEKVPELIDAGLYAHLETLFLEHYALREIAFETEAFFRYRLRAKWRLVIVKYNRIYPAIPAELKPFLTSYGTIKSEVINNDLPLNKLDPGIDYATNKQLSSSTSEGYAGITDIQLLNDFINTYRNTDEVFLNEFTDLFFKLY